MSNDYCGAGGRLFARHAAWNGLRSGEAAAIDHGDNL